MELYNSFSYSAASCNPCFQLPQGGTLRISRNICSVSLEKIVTRRHVRSQQERHCIALHSLWPTFVINEDP
jgi:hypothetical protein